MIGVYRNLTSNLHLVNEIVGVRIKEKESVSEPNSQT